MNQIITDSKATLPSTQYTRTKTPKTQIVLHHTAGSGNPFNTVNWWKNDTARNVATAYLIAGYEDKTKSYKNGSVYEVFPDDFWASHLGTKAANNSTLDKGSIGIEICNYGHLHFFQGKYFALFGSAKPVEIPAAQVTTLETPFRGFVHFQSYTNEQMESLYNLLLHLCIKHKIDRTYKEKDMWAFSDRAMAGINGIYTHCSYRKVGKWDAYPHPQLIEMLQRLSKTI